jgi:hypothetical protein
MLFLCYRAKFSLCFNPLTSKLCIQGKILSKIPKIAILIYMIVNSVFDFICKCTNYSLICINVLHKLHFSDK